MENFKCKIKRVRVIALYLIVIFFPITLILALVHESGHLIMASVFNIRVTGFVINWFPFSLEDSHVNFIFTSVPPTWQLIFLYAGGSLFTLLVGTLCFLLFYKKHLHPFLELAFFVYFITLSFEFFLYNLLDVNFLQKGDWYFIYQIAPQVSGIFLIAGIGFILLLVKYFPQIMNHVDVCW